jgi:hypothetical protein
MESCLALITDDKEVVLAQAFSAIIEQNALNYSVVFDRRSSFSTNRLTRLLSVAENEIKRPLG